MLQYRQRPTARNRSMESEMIEIGNNGAAARRRSIWSRRGASRLGVAMVGSALATAVAGVAAQSASATAIFVRQGTVTASPSLTIRTGLSTGYQAIGSVPYGATFGVYCVEYEERDLRAVRHHHDLGLREH